MRTEKEIRDQIAIIEKEEHDEDYVTDAYKTALEWVLEGTITRYILVYNLINKAEDQSAVTCEVCGRLGQLKNVNHWLMVRCDEHMPEGKVYDYYSCRND